MGGAWERRGKEKEMFQGFSTETNDFLWGIRLNNEKPWFEAHKQAYLTHVQIPLRELGAEVYEAFSARHPEVPVILRVCRIYRDARRLHGRGPYKSNLWFSLRSGEENWAALPSFWFGIRPESYGFGLGIYDARPALMARFRRDMDERPEVMGKLARAFEKQTVFTVSGEEYKRPKGEPPAPLDRWYNRKMLDLCCHRELDGLLYSRELVREVLDGFEWLLPYYHYFTGLCRQCNG